MVAAERLEAIPLILLKGPLILIIIDLEIIIDLSWLLVLFIFLFEQFYIVKILVHVSFD